MAKAIQYDANPFREATTQARKQLFVLLSRFEKAPEPPKAAPAKPTRAPLRAKKK